MSAAVTTAIKPTIIEGLLRHPMSQLMIRGAHVLALTERGQLWAVRQLSQTRTRDLWVLASPGLQSSPRRLPDRYRPPAVGK